MLLYKDDVLLYKMVSCYILICRYIRNVLLYKDDVLLYKDAVLLYKDDVLLYKDDVLLYKNVLLYKDTHLWRM